MVAIIVVVFCRHDILKVRGVVVVYSHGHGQKKGHV